VRRVHTSEAGFENLLYDFASLGPDYPGLERAYFSKIDNLAAQARQKLLHDHVGDWSPELRSAWSRFLMSLLHRTPNALEVFRDGIERMTVKGYPEVEAEWAKLRKDGEPERWLDACLAENPDFVKQRPLELLPRLIDNQNLGLFLNRMKWAVLRPSYRNWSFLISDNPLVVSNGLANPNGHVALALSRDALFLAISDQATLDAVLAMGARDIFQAYNTIIVQRAAKFVASSDRAQERFIRNNFGQKPVILLRSIFRELYDEAA
jgi:hypothetical protein